MILRIFEDKSLLHELQPSKPPRLSARGLLIAAARELSLLPEHLRSIFSRC
jgi:hypothetical protein